MKNAMILILTTLALANTSPHAMAADIVSKPTTQNTSTSDIKCSNLSPEDATKVGLIRQMLSDGKPHAAIAHLDAAGIKSGQAELLRADGLRQTGRELQAQAIYKNLLGNCLSGYAHRGLGLIASNKGNLQEAVQQLKAASEALPLEQTIRNDYGYILMQSGEYDLALHEFLTAVELAPDFKQAAHNLVMLLYKQGEIAKAEGFANQFGLLDDEIDHIKKLALKNSETGPQ